MDIDLYASTVSLVPDNLIAIRDAQGTGVRCVSGSLWITEGEGGIDTILEAGECFTLTQPGLALIMALETASLRLMGAERMRAGKLSGLVKSLLVSGVGQVKDAWQVRREPRPCDGT